MQLPAITTDLSKSSIKSLVMQAVSNIQESGDILYTIDLIAKMEYFIKELKSQPEYIEYAREEVSKYGRDVKLPSGTKIELAEVGIKYDFTYCNDPILQKAELAAAEADMIIKDRQAFLKSVPLEGMEILIDDEVVRLFPPSKSSTSSIKTTLLK